MRNTISFLPASDGDSILIQFIDIDNNPRNIWVDGGRARAYHRFIKNSIKDIYNNGEQIDLLISTHIDDDHIQGITEFINDKDFDKKSVGKWWFNFGENTKSQIRDSEDKNLSATKGKSLYHYIKDNNFSINKTPIKAGQIYEFFGAKLYILSPDEERLTNLNTFSEKILDLKSGKKKTTMIEVLYH